MAEKCLNFRLKGNWRGVDQLKISISKRAEKESFGSESCETPAKKSDGFSELRALPKAMLHYNLIFALFREQKRAGL